MLLNWRRNRRFSPADLAGLTAWYDAPQITGLADGAAVAQWDDRGGQGNHATQAVALNRPTYQTNEIGGRPVVRFVRASSLFLSANAVAASLAGVDVPFTMVAVIRRTDAVGVHEILAAARTTTTTPLVLLRTNGAAWTIVRRDDAAVIFEGGGPVTVDTTPHVLTYAFSGTVARSFSMGCPGRPRRRTWARSRSIRSRWER